VIRDAFIERRRKRCVANTRAVVTILRSRALIKEDEPIAAEHEFPLGGTGIDCRLPSTKSVSRWLVVRDHCDLIGNIKRRLMSWKRSLPALLYLAYDFLAWPQDNTHRDIGDISRFSLATFASFHSRSYSLVPTCDSAVWWTGT
jgi:hypothetical protein